MLHCSQKQKDCLLEKPSLLTVLKGQKKDQMDIIARPNNVQYDSKSCKPFYGSENIEQTEVVRFLDVESKTYKDKDNKV